MNALLSYGSSSSSSDSDSEKEVDEIPEKKPEKESTKPKLPKPTIGEPSELQTSVFTNPFVQAELAKAAILEKHVKMVPGKNETMMINGRKICWSYRTKGKCRFGHKCKFAHDSDVQKTNEELEDEKQKILTQSTTTCEGSVTQAAPPPLPSMLDPKLPTDDEVWEQGPDRKKARRPGLSQSLVPGKKVIQMYNDQKKKDSTYNKIKK